MFALILIIVLCFVRSIIAEYVDCTDGSCRASVVECIENSLCVINCRSENGCRNSTINCKNNQDCNIIVSKNSDNCFDSNIINRPNNANCIINGDQSNDAFKNGIIDCGIDGSCYFLFNQKSSNNNENFHLFKTFNGKNSKYIQTYKYGSGTIRKDLNTRSSILCPNNHENDKPTCDIICGGTTDACDDLDIYSLNGFNTTTESMHVSLTKTHIHCGDTNFSKHCLIDSNNPNQCAPSTTGSSVCHVTS